MCVSQQAFPVSQLAQYQRGTSTDTSFPSTFCSFATLNLNLNDSRSLFFISDGQFHNFMFISVIPVNFSLHKCIFSFSVATEGSKNWSCAVISGGLSQHFTQEFHCGTISPSHEQCCSKATPKSHE